jgi:hypothetical protein
MTAEQPPYRAGEGQPRGSAPRSRSRPIVVACVRRFSRVAAASKTLHPTSQIFSWSRQLGESDFRVTQFAESEFSRHDGRGAGGRRGTPFSSRGRAPRLCGQPTPQRVGVGVPFQGLLTSRGEARLTEGGRGQCPHQERGGLGARRRRGLYVLALAAGPDRVTPMSERCTRPTGSQRGSAPTRSGARTRPQSRRKPRLLGLSDLVERKILLLASGPRPGRQPTMEFEDTVDDARSYVTLDSCGRDTREFRRPSPRDASPQRRPSA